MDLHRIRKIYRFSATLLSMTKYERNVNSKTQLWQDDCFPKSEVQFKFKHYRLDMYNSITFWIESHKHSVEKCQ
jgi:hypothetical protein